MLKLPELKYKKGIITIDLKLNQMRFIDNKRILTFISLTEKEKELIEFWLKKDSKTAKEIITKKIKNNNL